MQIKEIRINNFKGISSLEFNPKKINIIVGRNNTGKTSVLEAINLLFDPDEISRYPSKYISDIVNFEAKSSELTAILSNQNPPTSLEILKPTDKADKTEIIYTFKKNLIEILTNALMRVDKYKKDVKEKIEITEEIKHEIENKIEKLITSELRSNILNKSIIVIKNKKDKKIKYHLEDKEEIQQVLEILKKLTEYINNKQDSELAKHSNFQRTIMNAAFELLLDEIYKYSYEVSNKRKVILIKNLLEKGIEEERKTPKKQKRIYEIEVIIKQHNLLENLERLDLDYVGFKEGTEIKFVPFSFLGDGFKAIVMLLFNLSNVKNKIVLLDEPETHMHPGYIRELVTMLIKISKELNIQFFISTHSGDFIDSFFDENFSPEELEYLKKELLIVRMGKIGNSTIVGCSDYEKSKYDKKELLLDLRGI